MTWRSMDTAPKEPRAEVLLCKGKEVFPALWSARKQEWIMVGGAGMTISNPDYWTPYPEPPNA